ncbi:MAG: DUF5716 family protein [Lachnospiraceae bacterium]|nr:DUF5716 family protein [Lachnospiraceae bacterium]
MELIAGIDLCKDFTQLCVYNTDTLTMDSVSLSTDKQSLRTPTALTYSRDPRDWMLYSPRHLDSSNYVCVKDIYEMAQEDRTMIIDGREYSADMFFSRFFRRIMNCAQDNIDVKCIKGVTISIKAHDEMLEKHIAAGLESFGIPKEKYRILTHTEAFMYFVVMQNKDIWINDVGLFDFDDDSFKYYVLHFGRKQQPMSVVAESNDFSEMIQYRMLEDETEKLRLAYAFENLCSNMLHKQNVSAVYTTGNGFETNWADEILKRLSNGRRIFRGQNLFVKGAAYSSLLFFEGGISNFLMIGEDNLKSSIALRAVSNAEVIEIPFGEIGQNYREAGGSCEIIMDGTNEIDFMIHNALKKDFFCAIMTLDALEMRSNKTTRLKVDVRFASRDVAVVTVRDIGFGSVRKTDYRIWEQVLNL